MNIILDTHIILWWLNDDKELSVIHREIISNTDNLCYISAATIWEISIKTALDKLKISPGYISELKNEGFLQLNVNWLHCDFVRELPLIHKDPFDRLLIAQAKIEDMILLTNDNNIRKYDVKTL